MNASTPSTGPALPPVDLTHLYRVRNGVRAALALGVAASVAGNVLHAEPTIVGRAIASWSPLALLLTVELISRVPVNSRRLAVLRMLSTGAIAGIAAWVSYWHMVSVAAANGEGTTSAHLLPLSVDGLVIVASVSLVEIAARLRQTSTAQTTTVPADDATEPVERVWTSNEIEGRKALIESLARMRDQHPDWTPNEATSAVMRLYPGIVRSAGANVRGITAEVWATPAPALDTPPAAAVADVEADPVPAPRAPRPAGPAAGRRGGRPSGTSTAATVTRLRAAHPDWTVARIAEKAGVTERTARRHLNTPAPAATTPPAPVATSGPATSIGTDGTDVAPADSDIAA